MLNLPVNHFFPQLSDQLTPAHILADHLMWGGKEAVGWKLKMAYILVILAMLSCCRETKSWWEKTKRAFIWDVTAQLELWPWLRWWMLSKAGPGGSWPCAHKVQAHTAGWDTWGRVWCWHYRSSDLQGVLWLSPRHCGHVPALCATLTPVCLHKVKESWLSCHGYPQANCKHSTVCEKSLQKNRNLQSRWAGLICYLLILLQIYCLSLWGSRNIKPN